MSWEQIKPWLKENGPAKTSTIADALALDQSDVTGVLNDKKEEGLVSRIGHKWTLGSGDLELVAAKPRGGRRTKDPHEVIAEKLEQQEAWAQEALDEYLESTGDPGLKVLMDNLTAAKAARAAWDETREAG